MRFSVLIPTRGCPERLARCAHAVFSTASDPQTVELICRLDADDDALPAYSEVLKQLIAAGMNSRFIIGSRHSGYASYHLFVEDCARLSSGKFLIQFNDDMIIMTTGWDSIYSEALADRVPVIGTGKLTRDGTDGDQCQFACCVVPRSVYDRCGELCLGQDPSLDRCWSEFASIAHCEVKTDVKISHTQSPTHNDGGARSSFYSSVLSNWAKKSEQWRSIGQKYADKFKP